MLLVPRPRPPTASERTFIDPRSGTRRPFPPPLGSRHLQPPEPISDLPADNTLASNPPVSLSVIVPAFKEELRLPAMMAEATAYLDARLADSYSSRSPFSYEIIVVDDGSSDRTSQVALDIARNHIQNPPKELIASATAAAAAATSAPRAVALPSLSSLFKTSKSAKPISQQAIIDALAPAREIRVMTLELNRGKGGAVTQGILASRGALVHFADADGATRFMDIADLESQIKAIQRNDLAVAIGSRAHMVNTEAVVKRTFIRNFLMRVFHLLVFIFGVQSIRDTQCGFKLFTRHAATHIFPNVHVEGWIFDIELLIIASKCNIPIAEVPVTWHEINGSKVSLIRDSIQMLLQLIMIRIHYLFGLWTIMPPSEGATTASLPPKSDPVVADNATSPALKTTPTSNTTNLRSRTIKK